MLLNISKKENKNITKKETNSVGKIKGGYKITS
jgi:hypothetical protein